MKILSVMIAVGISLSGCASPRRQPPTKPPPRKDRILLLDNSGGYSHAGRRVELLRDGGVIDTQYTDVIGGENGRKGRYTIEGDVLDLRFGDRGNQRLMRVSYDNDIYWVYRNEVAKIVLPESTLLRQTALKQK